MAFKDISWIIGAAIYVGFMFPMFYSYSVLHETSFGIYDIIATIGGLMVLAQMFFAAIPKEPTREQVEKSKETGKPVSP
ncbi:MAG: hypothetical protein PXY39_00810 [archaeon]|nr:hypothetical protein [archaeon]